MIIMFINKFDIGGIAIVQKIDSLTIFWRDIRFKIHSDEQCIV